jgi:hypothetical protein
MQEIVGAQSSQPTCLFPYFREFGPVVRLQPAPFHQIVNIIWTVCGIKQKKMRDSDAMQIQPNVC